MIPVHPTRTTDIPVYLWHDYPVVRVSEMPERVRQITKDIACSRPIVSEHKGAEYDYVWLWDYEMWKEKAK